MGEEGAEQFSEQFVVAILDFSSQYGNASGFSYTAQNILGRPSSYPLYGDSSRTYAPRTYGSWWKRSSAVATNSFSADEFIQTGQDFIDVQYQKPVYPDRVNVYETYNGGCIRRVWAGDGKGKWKLLWQKLVFYSPKSSTIFSPKLHRIQFLTSVIRIEIDSSLADYYPEIDAVSLIGTECSSPTQELLKLSVSGLSQKIIALGIHNATTDLNVIDNMLQSYHSTQSTSKSNCLHHLPEEVLRMILSHLDLHSLCSCACVSTTLHTACQDPSLFTSITLKPYWYCVNRSALEWLSVRAHLLQHLDLSWCGAYGIFDAADFNWFIKKVGNRLRTLRLESCQFLNNETLYWISACCSSLQELNLNGCRRIESSAFWHLGKLHQLERLVLDSTEIELPILLVNLQSMASLIHLSIASCPNLSHCLDEIVRWLYRYKPGIRSLDVWRSGHLSSNGMEFLVGLIHLEELDIGWCGLPQNGNGISQLAKRCPGLKKLFLTATRVITDIDLKTIALCCPQLRQLDLLGNSYITPEGCSRILENCKKLQLLDVSYCRQIEESTVITWKNRYPSVSIKQISVNEVE